MLCRYGSVRSGLDTVAISLTDTTIVRCRGWELAHAHSKPNAVASLIPAGTELVVMSQTARLHSYILMRYIYMPSESCASTMTCWFTMTHQVVSCVWTCLYIRICSLCEWLFVLLRGMINISLSIDRVCLVRSKLTSYCPCVSGSQPVCVLWSHISLWFAKHCIVGELIQLLTVNFMPWCSSLLHVQWLMLTSIM